MFASQLINVSQQHYVNLFAAGGYFTFLVLAHIMENDRSPSLSLGPDGLLKCVVFVT